MLAAAIALHLDSVGLVDYRPDTSGGDCFVSWMPDSPDELVAVFPTGGQPQGSLLPHDLPTFQVRARGGRFDPVTPHDRLVGIAGQLHGLDGVLLAAGTGHEVWVSGITALQSHPVSIGRDGNERPEHTINFQAVVANSTVRRPPITA